MLWSVALSLINCTDFQILTWQVFWHLSTLLLYYLVDSNANSWAVQLAVQLKTGSKVWISWERFGKLGGHRGGQRPRRPLKEVSVFNLQLIVNWGCTSNSWKEASSLSLFLKNRAKSQLDSFCISEWKVQITETETSTGFFSNTWR